MKWKMGRGGPGRSNDVSILRIKVSSVPMKVVEEQQSSVNVRSEFRGEDRSKRDFLVFVIVDEQRYDVQRIVQVRGISALKSSIEGMVFALMASIFDSLIYSHRFRPCVITGTRNRRHTYRYQICTHRRKEIVSPRLLVIKA